MITVAYRDFRTSAAATAVLYVLPSDLHATGEHCFRGHHASVLHCHRLLHRTSAMPEIRTLGSVRKTTPVAASDFYPSSAQRFGTEDDASCCKKKTRGKKKENRWLWLDARRARRPNLYSTSTTARQQIQTRHLTDRC